MVLPSSNYVEKVVSRDDSDLAVEERRTCIEEARAARIAMRASASTSANTTQTASCSSGPCFSWRLRANEQVHALEVTTTDSNTKLYKALEDSMQSL